MDDQWSLERILIQHIIVNPNIAPRSRSMTIITSESRGVDVTILWNRNIGLWWTIGELLALEMGLEMMSSRLYNNLSNTTARHDMEIFNSSNSPAVSWSWNGLSLTPLTPGKKLHRRNAAIKIRHSPIKIGRYIQPPISRISVTV